MGRVLKAEPTKDGLSVVIGVGSNQGIDVHWHGAVLVGGTDRPLDNGDVLLVRVAKGVSFGNLHLTFDQLRENQRVRLIPPGPPRAAVPRDPHDPR